MNQIKNIFLLAFILIGSICLAQDSCLLSNDCNVKILGTSNLHNWDETVGHTSGYGIVNWNNDGSFDLNAVKIIMDVHSITSESSIMTNKTCDALKANANPKITFILDTPVKSIQAGLNGTSISAIGYLTIAGVTKIIDMHVKVSSPEKGELIIQGSQPIKMSDYSIRPPTALFGALKTGDEITLNFKTIFIKSN